jgi:Lrp/AsnC family leucine-responsive transcriptional regulator
MLGEKARRGAQRLISGVFHWIYSLELAECAAKLRPSQHRKQENILPTPNKTLRDLDRTDRKILEALQGDGRIANADLAKLINLSPTPTLERVRRLEREGFIERYAAILNPEKMEAALLAFVEVALDRTTEDILDRFAQAARATDEIVECHMVAGGFDYLLKIRVADMNAYRRFLGSGLAALPGVRATHTYMVMEQVKASIGLPVRQKQTS